METREKQKYPLGKNPNSLANLKKCKKGETHNPYGRPRKEKSITECLRRLVKSPGAEGKTNAQLLAEVWYEKAKSDFRYFEMILDRLEGKITQPIGSDSSMPLVVNVNRIVAHVTEDNGDTNNTHTS